MDSASSLPAIEAEALGKRFGKQWALAHVDLRVAVGEVLLLAGSNGSGKTTMLRTVAGLYKPNRGTLKVFGKDVVKQRFACRRQLSMVGHNNYLYSQLTALETLRTWVNLNGAGYSDDALIDLLDQVDLAAHRNKAAGGFSAGMSKRLTLLRTRIERPRIVLLDEPFSALDTDGQRLVEDWIGNFKAEGITVVMASHRIALAAGICDRAVHLQQGQISWIGSGEGLMERVGVAA